jgi:hypothetical protein
MLHVLLANSVMHRMDAKPITCQHITKSYLACTCTMSIIHHEGQTIITIQLECLTSELPTPCACRYRLMTSCTCWLSVIASCTCQEGGWAQAHS